MQRRTSLTHLILTVVIALVLALLMVAVDAQAQIVFMSDRVWDDLQWEIYVMDTDGGNQRNLTNALGDDEYPSWSPDGKQIVFTADRSGKDWNRQIYVMDTPMEGISETSLKMSLTNGGPSWSPDGKRIAFVSR